MVIMNKLIQMCLLFVPVSVAGEIFSRRDLMYI